jgi:DNA repair protein RadD
MTYTLRPRQEEAVNKIDSFILNTKKNNGLFVYPTSFGKSLVIANLASKYPNKYFINVTNSKELLKQNYEKYTSYGFEADICSASLNSKSVGRVTFATITTLSKFVNFFKDKEVVIVDDEAQEGSKTGSQLHNFIKKLNNYKLVGVTATPFRLSQGMDGTSLKMMNRDRSCIYKSIEDVVQISEVVAQNYWSKLEYDIKDVDEESLELNSSGTEFTDDSMKKFKEENDIDSRVVEEIENLIAEGRKSILVSVPFISDAKEIMSKIDNCEAVYSGMDVKERDRIIEDFKSLKLKVVVQCKILSVGFDHPELDAIIMAKPTNSLTFYYQYLGRGVRIHKNKKDCKVVDLSGNFNRFGKIETITIEENEITKGWAAFNEDVLLTNYPLNTKNRPTKKTLQNKLEWEFEKQKEPSSQAEIKFYFGKYKDKTVSQVMKENKSYLTWLLDQKDFKWFGANGVKLKETIEKELGVYVKKETKVYKSSASSPNDRSYLQNYTQNIRTINDLKDIW